MTTLPPLPLRFDLVTRGNEQVPVWSKDDMRAYGEACAAAALNLWPRDCRLCANYTTKSGGCTSLVQCVDSNQFRQTTPRQYWVGGTTA